MPITKLQKRTSSAVDLRLPVKTEKEKLFRERLGVIKSMAPIKCRITKWDSDRKQGTTGVKKVSLMVPLEAFPNRCTRKTNPLGLVIVVDPKDIEFHNVLTGVVFDYGIGIVKQFNGLGCPKCPHCVA